MHNSMSEKDVRLLLTRIKYHKHTPIHIAIALAISLSLSVGHKVHAEPLQVYIERTPSLIDEHGYPLGKKILHAIEAISDLTFEFTQSSYSRALLSLKEHQADIILHVPYGIEPGFSEYGIYLDWTAPVKADLYSFTPELFQDISRIGVRKIGIPRGNASFASAATGIPRNKFYEASSMDSLIKMLVAKRIDLIWFDRVSTQQALRGQRIKNIYYYEIPKFGKQGSVGFGLQKTEKGLRLKEKIDYLITQIDLAEIMLPYYKHLQPELPQTGMIDLDRNNEEKISSSCLSLSC